jgi:Tol biopolymer transport system component
MKITKLDRGVGAVLGISLFTLALMLLIDRALGVRVALNFPDASAQISTTSRETIAYLSPASGGREVWIDTLDGNKAALTDTGGRVFDFAISSDGLWIVFSVINETGGIDLWLAPTDGSSASLLVDCELDRCTVPDWSVDSERIAYSREQFTAGSLDPPRLWTVNPSNGQTAAVYQDSQILGYAPNWSPDGSLLAFLDDSIGGIRILEIEGGDEQVLPTRMGLVGDWSPDSRYMMFNVLLAGEENIVTGLRLADLADHSTALIEIDANQIQEYGVPAWSPMGDWVLVGLQVVQSGPGKQLWLMRPDGSEAHPLVEHSDFTHGGYKWDPGSSRIIYQRFALNDPGATPELRLYDLASGVDRHIAADASSGTWIP